MNIAVVGYLGFGNFGDQLFLEAFRQLFPDDEVQPWVHDMDPAWIDRVIVGGGDLIIPHAFWEPYFPVGLADLPTVVYGVGVVQEYGSQDWPAAQLDRYRQALRRARAVVTRDPASALRIQEHGLYPTPEFAPDLGFAYREPTFRLRRVSEAPTCGLVIANYPPLERELIMSLLRQLPADWHVLLIPVLNHATNPYADRAVCKALSGEIASVLGPGRVSITTEVYSLEHTYRRLQTLDLLISFKMHPSLVALRAGIPVLCLGRAHKKLHLMSEFGLADYNVPSDTEHAPALYALRSLVERRHELRATLTARARQLEADARDAAGRLVDLVHA